MFQAGEIFVKKTKYGLQIYFKFLGGLEGETPKSFWDNVRYSASEHGTQLLNKILGVRETFQFPKSPHAVRDCIKTASSNKEAVILDFFAGSGTTAQAVLELNKEDGGSRKFILCTNNENNIATEVCFPRVSKVIMGYKINGDEKVEGLGGNLKYFKTDFVNSEPTDGNKKRLTREAVGMLCIKEGTFDLVKETADYKIFKNDRHYCGVILDSQAIIDFKRTIDKIDGKFSVYVFSLGDDSFDEEFADVKNKVKLSPIPEAIMKTYRRIFK